MEATGEQLDAGEPSDAEVAVEFPPADIQLAQVASGAAAIPDNHLTSEQAIRREAILRNVERAKIYGTLIVPCVFDSDIRPKRRPHKKRRVRPGLF